MVVQQTAAPTGTVATLRGGVLELDSGEGAGVQGVMASGSAGVHGVMASGSTRSLGNMRMGKGELLAMTLIFVSPLLHVP